MNTVLVVVSDAVAHVVLFWLNKSKVSRSSLRYLPFSKKRSPNYRQLFTLPVGEKSTKSHSDFNSSSEKQNEDTESRESRLRGCILAAATMNFPSLQIDRVKHNHDQHL